MAAADDKNREFRAGDIVRHFKRETLSETDRLSNKYLYQIVGIAAHSETGEKLMVYAKGYFDSEDSEEARYQKRAAMCAQRLEDLKAGEYKLGGGVVDPLPEDAPFFVKDYYDYYKTDRGYHKRSLNSNGGWNVIGCESFVNQPILKYSNEIRSAVLLVHGEKAHSCYFSKDAYADMIKDSKYADNKELMIIPDAVHTDLYDGGDKDYIPFDKLENFFKENLK